MKKQFQIDIEDDEIGYVALHIHSAIEDEKVSQAMQMARSVRECISMVEEAIGKPIDIASLSYNRLMNHIRYMVARALSGEKLKVNMNDYMEVKFQIFWDGTSHLRPGRYESWSKAGRSRDRISGNAY